MAMHTRQSVLADAVENSKTLVSRFCAGFDDTNHTRQTNDLRNHFAWNMGHLALTMHRVSGFIDHQLLPEIDFIEGATHGDKQRFGSSSVGFGSAPTDDPAIYPTHARCIEIFDRAIARLAGSVRHVDDATLDKIVKWGAGESAIGLLIPRMLYHNGVHTGQIIDLRRALGMKNVLG